MYHLLFSKSLKPQRYFFLSLLLLIASLCLFNRAQASTVEITSFKAEKQLDGNQLIWSTSTETNSFKFEIEVATTSDLNGNLLYNKIGELQAAGQSTSLLNYEYLDVADYSGATAYYRLKQVNADLTYIYFTATVVMPTSQIQKPRVFPNPARTSLTCEVSLSYETPVSIHVMNILGQEMISLETTLAAGENSIPLEVSALKRGFYFLDLYNHSSGQPMRVTFNKF